MIKNELEAAERWIQERQKELRDQNTKLEEAQDNIKDVLEKTGAFSTGDIKSNLELLGNKINDNNKQLEVYEDLLQRARSAYA